jgi:hypothetical protein
VLGVTEVSSDVAVRCCSEVRVRVRIRMGAMVRVSRLHRNSTVGTGTHSAGKLTKTEVSGKEDKRV